MDIRSFFQPKTTTTTKTSKSDQTHQREDLTKKRSKKRSSSEKEDSHQKHDSRTAKTCKASKRVDTCDSDDDFVPSSSNSRDKKTKKKENSPQQKVKPKKTREKSVKPSAADKTPKVQDSSKRKIKEQVDIISHHSKKRKVADQELHEDQDFLAVLEDHDRDAKAKSKEKSRDHSKKATGSRNHRTKVQDALERNKTRRSTPQKSVSTPRKSNQNDDIRSSKAVTATTKLPEIPMSDVLWVDKYKPTNLKSIIGQQGEKSNMNKLKKWLTNWTRHHSGGKKPPPRPPPFAHNDDGSWAKAALLSGPPGVGKTTTSYLVAKELGYDVMELNASDARSKKRLQSHLHEALTSASLSKTSTKRVILMDEVDGMAGNEDRGGVAELILLLKHSKIPVICMCNDRNHQKIRSLANYCFDLRFQRPRADQIKAAMMSICFKEKIKIEPSTLMEMIVGCNQDIRQVLHHLSLMKDTASKSDSQTAKKTSIKIGPWDVVRKVFSASEQRDMSIMDKSDLFFHDYSLGPLFVQENYLLSNPKAAHYDAKKTIILTSKAADSICNGDLIDKAIRSGQAWSLLPTEAIFASVIPGEYMAGQMTGQIQFPAWLGKFSKQNKIDRNLQELEAHMRLSSSLSKRSLNMDFAQHLRDAITRPMVERGGDGVPEAVTVMEKYALTREDLDNLLEITTWPDNHDPFKTIEPKVKAAFTRAYNKDVVLPYAKTVNPVKKNNRGGGGEDLLAGEEDGDDGDAEDKDDSIEADANIKAKRKAALKKSKPAKESSAVDKGSKKGKGRGKTSKK